MSNQRFPKRGHVQRVPPTPIGTKVLFRSVAITGKSVEEFARCHEKALNDLSSDGFQLLSMFERDDGAVITAQKQEALNLSPPIMASPIEAPDEVSYHYLEGEHHRSVTCRSVPEAVEIVRKHLKERDDILPLSIHCVKITTYEAMELAGMKILQGSP